MVEVRIDRTDGTWWLYVGNDWKDYVCGENFDESVVLTGNKRYGECVEASWYKRAEDVLRGIDCYDEYPEDVSEDVNAKLKSMYENCNYTEEILVDVIRLLYPNDTFKTGTIRGYYQGDWQEYIIKGDVDVNALEALYFGKVADVTVNDNGETYGDVMTDDELWEAERIGFVDYIRKRYDIDEDEELHIYKADGMKQVVDWQEVC